MVRIAKTVMRITGAGYSTTKNYATNALTSMKRVGDYLEEELKEYFKDRLFEIYGFVSMESEGLIQESYNEGMKNVLKLQGVKGFRLEDSSLVHVKEPKGED
jgi:hypothetical protein